MKVIKPTPSQAAFALKKFLEENGVSMKISKTQEAVSRLLGYANWNALTADVDPRVGMPQGCLQQDGEDAYTLLGGAQTTVMIAVNNLQVSVKHDDQGVVVDIFSKKELETSDGFIECIGSTWVMFAEADNEDGEDEDSEVRLEGPEDLLKSLLIAVSVQDSSCDSAKPLSTLNKEAIRKELKCSGSVDSDREIFAFCNDQGRRVSVPLRHLLNASAMGETGWMLPDGNELWVTPRPANAALDADFKELLDRLLVASEVELLDTRFGPVLPLVSKDIDTIRKAMSGVEFEPATEVIRFKSLDGSVHGITIGALLKSNQDSADSWRLPSGTRLSVLEENRLDDSSYDYDASKRSSESYRDLLKKLLTGSHAKDSVIGKGNLITYKNKVLLSNALAGMHSEGDLNTSVLEFTAENGKTRNYSLGELLEAVPKGASGFGLSGGRVLYAWHVVTELAQTPVPKADLAAGQVTEGWFDVDVYATRERWEGRDGADEPQFADCYQVTVVAVGQHKMSEPGERVYVRFNR